MALSAEQNAYVQRVTDEMDRLAEVIKECVDLEALYTDRSYGSGGQNPITDADLTAAGYDWNANDLANGMNLCIQIANFRDNAAVTQGDYGQIMSTLRGLS